MGIVYFPPDILEWQTLAKSWMNTCSKKWINDCKSFLWDLFGWIFPPVTQKLITGLYYQCNMFPIRFHR